MTKKIETSYTVRIPAETFRVLREYMESEVYFDDEGRPVRKPSPIGLEAYSNAQIINTALLGFLSGIVSPDELNVLIHGTPKVGTQMVHLVSQRLAPKQSVLIPATAVSDLLKQQEINHQEIKELVINESKKSTRRFGFIARMFGFVTRALAALSAYEINRPSTDRKSYMDDDAQGAYQTLLTFGDEMRLRELEEDRRLETGEPASSVSIGVPTMVENREVQRTDSVIQESTSSASSGQFDDLLESIGGGDV